MIRDASERACSAPAVSVVIPTFNRARDIGRCLDALVVQTFRDFEVLVCDDGSVDGTAEVVRGYEDKLDLTYTWSENFGGPARPRNMGVRQARGEFVALLDSDDWWHPEKLQESVRYLRDGADLVYHDLYFVTKLGQSRLRARSGTRPLGTPVVEDLLMKGNAINNSSVVVRRALLEAAGGFSEERELIAAEDYDAWVRIAKLTDRFVRIPRTLGYYWLGDGNITNPRRTITTLDALEAKYERELAELRRGRNVYWLAYARARSYYQLDLRDSARDQLSRMGSELPLRVRLKKLWMLAMMAFGGARVAQTERRGRVR